MELFTKSNLCYTEASKPFPFLNLQKKLVFMKEQGRADF